MSSDTGNVVTHPDQDVKNAYMVAVWNSTDPAGDPGSPVLRAIYNPDGSQIAPYSFGLADVNNASLDFHTNFFVAFMSGLDIEALNDNLQTRMINSPAVNADIAAHDTYLENDINQNTYSKLGSNLRDICSAITPSYSDAQSMMETNRGKVVSKYSADIKLEMLKTSQVRWERHLQWNEKVVAMYLDELKWYYSAADGWFKLANDVQAKNAIWPWTILDQYRAIVGCLNGAPTGFSTKQEASTMQQAASAVGIAQGVINIIESIASAA